MVRVLLVNGDFDEAALVAEALALRGFEVVIAHNALEARVLLRKQSLDLAILNLYLPDLDAFSLIEIAGELMQGIPSILTTAHPDANTVLRAASAGFKAVIAKPFSMETLLERVSQIVAGEKS
ncbi:MAG: response regulator [Leptospirales bacterium]|nr:response regulator [Leptospirales bacterium]